MPLSVPLQSTSRSAYLRAMPINTCRFLAILVAFFAVAVVFVHACERIVGPDLDEVLPGQQESEIEESIVDPEAKIAQGYPKGVMPQNFKEKIPPEELKQLVEFLSESAGKE